MEIVLGTPVGTLGDVCQVEARFGLFGDSISLGARSEYSLRRMYHGLGNLFKHTRWNFLVTLVKWKLVSDSLEIILFSTQDRCTVCAERTIGLEIILDTSDGTPR
jgi:hypothetical protein